MTYNARFGTSYAWGNCPIAEYSMPSQDGSGAQLLLCEKHAKAKTNYAQAQPVTGFCDSICDDCSDAWFRANRGVQ